MSRRYKTIKEYAEHLLTKTDFVDCYGRNIGLDYDTIIAKIKAEFPRAKTTKRALRFVLYTIDRTVRMPARYRSHKVLSVEYARSLLLVTKHGVGLSFNAIDHRVHRKFPGFFVSHSRLQKLATAMKRKGMKVPETRA